MMPPQSRWPVPSPATGVAIVWLWDAGHRRCALAVELAYTAYLRPTEQLKVADLIKHPFPGAGDATGRYSVVIRPAADMVSKKTGSARIRGAGPARHVPRQLLADVGAGATVQSSLFGLSQNEYADIIQEAVQRVGAGRL